MIDALRYEGVRIRTIGSTYWTLLVAVALCALVAVGFGLDTRGTEVPPAVVTVLLMAGGETLPFPVLGMAVALIGILATGHEYRYGTIYPTLTAIPRRSILLAAKVIMVSAVAAIAALVSVGVCWVIGSIARGVVLPIAERPIPVVLVGYVVLMIIYSVLGVALGQLTRAIPAAVVIVLVTPLVIEPVISALSGLDVLSWLHDVVPFLPFGAGMQLLNAGLSEAAENTLGRWEGGGVFAGFVAVVLGVGWLLLERRDA